MNIWNRLWKAGKLLLPTTRSYSCNRVYSGVNCVKTPPLAETAIPWPMVCGYPQSASASINMEERTIIKTLYQSTSLLQASMLEQSVLNSHFINPTNMILPMMREEEATDEGESERNGKLCGSVLKKRRSKMNKHKYKKRRKKFKFLRRALGK